MGTDVIESFLVASAIVAAFLAALALLRRKWTESFFMIGGLIIGFAISVFGARSGSETLVLASAAAASGILVLSSAWKGTKAGAGFFAIAVLLPILFVLFSIESLRFVRRESSLWVVREYAILLSFIAPLLWTLAASHLSRTLRIKPMERIN
jgi:hypothetical protein